MQNNEQRPSVSGNTRVLRIPGGKTKQIINIATWNVRSLREYGKLANTIKEMKRLNIDLLGISETWWSNSGQCINDGTTFYYSGNDNSEHRRGVGILVSSKVAKAVTSFLPKSDRAMLLRINAKPLPLNIIQVYAPTADSSDNDIEDFYSQLKELLTYTKPHEINIIMGDFNAKVGSEEAIGVTGQFGLGIRNDRGNRLIQFCQEERYMISNTLFKLPARRLYTWKSPNDSKENIVRNQIDFILINKRFATFITKATTYPGADVPSDHNLLFAKLKIKLTSVKKGAKKNYLDLEKLKIPHYRDLLSTQINDKLQNIIENSSENMNPLELWTNTSIVLNTRAKSILGNKKMKAKQKWMTNEILELMEERRKHRNCNMAEYYRIHRIIRSKIREAKITWLEERCTEIEQLQTIHDEFNLHKKLKEVCKLKKPSSLYILHDSQNKIITDNAIKIKEWEDYLKHLFADASRSINEDFLSSAELSGPPILKSEILKAIQQTKNNKAPGCDEIPAEILKLIDEERVSILEKVFNHIYNTGIFPEIWLRSTFVTFPKKNNAKKCKDFRLISLMCHTMKVFLRILQQRIYSKCESSIGRTQFGFREAMGTREALMGIQVLLQNCKDVHKDVYVCFIDYEKAFDRVQHDKLIEILLSLNIDTKDIRCIKNLYWNQTAEVRFGDIKTNQISIHRGVRQGCILSPLLFNIYSERIFQEALDGLNVGIKVNGEYINNIRYADDTTLLADNAQDLQLMIDKVNSVSNNFGLNINIDKTKYMIVKRSQNPNTSLSFEIDNQLIERVANFKYLGCWLEENWTCEREVRCRIEMARNAFSIQRKILTNRSIDINLRIRFLKCYVWSILLYGVETWTLKTTQLNLLESFEMWCYRRILKISWTERVTNNEVLIRAQREKELLKIIKRRKIAYFGHVMRGDKYELLQLILQGRIDGRRGIGRKQLSWLRNIRNWTGLSTIGDLIHTARNRQQFREIVNNII